MAINLLKIKDESLVKKTDKTRTLTIDGVTREYAVYQVDLGLLYPSDWNYHVATESFYFMATKKQLYMQAQDDYLIKQYNECIEKIYRYAYPKTPLCRYYSRIMGEHESLVNYQEQIDNEYMGIVLSDGRIMDGNLTFFELKDIIKRQENEREESKYYYLRAMHHIRKNNKKPEGFVSLKKGEKREQKPVYFNTIILNLDAQKDKDKEKLMELEINLIFNRLNNLHCEKCQTKNCSECKSSENYNMLDICIGLFRDLVWEKKYSLEEYETIKSKTIYGKDLNLEECIEIATIIYEFLRFIRLPGRFNCLENVLDLDANHIVKEFGQVRKVLKSIEEEDKYKWKKILFTYIILTANYGSFGDIYPNYMPIFAEGKHKLYEKELYELSDSFEKVFGKRKIILSYSRVGELAYDNQHIKEDMDSIIFKAQAHNESEEAYKNAIKENADIEALELPVRIHNSIKRAGIQNVGQLMEMKEEDVNKLRNLSGQNKERLRMIIELLHQLKENIN